MVNKIMRTVHNAIKGNILLRIFLQGIFAFFSGTDNPLDMYRRCLVKRKDVDMISKDWINVGNDIRKAYDSKYSF